MECSTHRCPFIRGFRPDQLICQLGGESVWEAKDGYSDKPNEPRPPPDPPPKKQPEVYRRPSSPSIWKSGGSFPVIQPETDTLPEIDEEGHKIPPQRQSTVFIAPFSPEELPKPSEDITEQISTAELVEGIEKTVANAWKPPTCPECGGRLDKKPGVCASRAHLMSYERATEAHRLRQARYAKKRNRGIED